MTTDALNDAIALAPVARTIEHPAATPTELALLQWAADHPIDRPTLPVNGRGQYQTAPPDGGKATGHTRASTFAEALSDAAGLTTWRHRLLARGLVSTDDLVAAARQAGTDGKKLSAVIGTALHVAGEKLAADIGTAMHTAIEHALMVTGHHPPAPYDADVAAVLVALADHHIAIDADHLEWTLYVPGDRLNGHGPVVGRCDALATTPCCERHHVVDWKTGSDVRRLTYAIQTTTYARATHRWDGTAWTPIDAICDRTAYLVQIRPGTAEATITTVDLTAAAPYVDLAAEVRRARSTTTRGRLFTDAPTMAVAEALETTLAAQDAGASDADPPVAPGQGEGAHDTPSPDVATRRTWLLARFAAVADEAGAQAAKDYAGAHWPADVPTEPAEWTNDHIDALVALADEMESRGGVSFPPTDPTKPDPAVAKAAEMAPPAAPPALERTVDEGAWVERHHVDALLAQVGGMGEGPRHLAAGWTQQARIAGASFGTIDGDSRWSERCLAVNTATYELAVAFGGDDPHDANLAARHLLATVTGDDLHEAWSTGAVIASLTIAEATRLAQLAAAYRAGDTEAAATVAAAFTRAA